jgi:magnesium transporter
MSTSVAAADDGLQVAIGTAAQHASLDVPVVSPDDTVGAVLAGLAGRRFASASVIAVCSGDRLTGLATIEKLLAAPADAVVAAVMDADPPTVAPGTDQEKAAWTAVQHGEPGLAVVGSDGRFRGLIPPQRLLGVLLAEHDEDMARLGGYLGTGSLMASARTASEERVSLRLWHRLPWLLIGLAGALAAAGIVGAFEGVLQRHVLLAFFVPGVVYLADAVGVQTVTLVVRGLSVGVGIRSVLRRELITGVLVGLLLSAAVLPLILLLWGDVRIATAVAVALFAASSIATGVAMLLPWLLDRLGRDPAYGSGPLATVVQDLLSIAIYLATATVILG